MSQDYSPSLVTKNLVFCGDAAMKSAAGPATLLYDKVNDNNGTMYNGSCVDFDGTDDYVDNTSFSSHQVDSGTIVVWANPRSIGSDGYVLSVGGATTLGANRCIRDTSGKWSLVTYGSGGTEDYNNFGPSIVTGQWYHLAFVWSGTSATAYVDGVAYSTTLSGMITPTGTVMAVGRAPWSTSSGTSRFDGQAADARVYNVALSAANIKELYDDSKVIIPTKNDASGGFVSQTNLKNWWPMIDGSGTIAYDGSGNGKDGTLTNMDAATDWLTGQTGAPQLVEGYNRPLLSDGATDLYVNYGDPSTDLDIGTGDFALGYWINPKTITGNYIGHVTYTTTTATARFEVAFYGSTTRVYTTNGSWNDTLYGPPLNTWTHFLWIREAGTLYLHINGSSSSSWSLSSSVTLGPCSSLIMLKHAASGTYAALDGLLNEVVFYVGTSLSNAQKAALAATDVNGGPLPPNPASGPSSLPSTSYLKGYWRNDSDVTWTDLSGSGNDGTVTNSNGSILFKQGINGQKNVNTGRDNQGFPLRCQNNGAIGFKQAGDTYLQMPTSMDFQVSTLLLWVKFTELGKYFIRVAGASPGYYQWYLWADGKLQFEYSRTETGVAASSIVGTAGDIVADTWYHLGVILDSGGATGTMYKDGNLLKQSAWGTNGALTPSSVYAGFTSASFGGQMANLQMYNRALTYAEIQQNYKAFKSRFGK